MSLKPHTTQWHQFFQRWANTGLSLQGQIRQMLVSVILDEQHPVDAPIPSSREMAAQLGVARNTVVIAYQQLVDEGYLVSRERKGYFINTNILAGRVERTAGPREAPLAPPEWSRRFRFRPTEQRNIQKRADWQRFPYPFLYGQFDSSLFPIADWRECCMKTLSVLEINEWAQDMIFRDDASLVEQIRTRVLPRRGVWATNDEIIITVGAQQALYLLADLLVSSDTPVGLESPGYPDARNIFSSRSQRIVNLPVDDGGLQVSDTLYTCDYIYVTPSHQCPTTVTMPIERRHALLEMAEKADFILIEDDYESENRLHGDPLPTLKSLDRSDRVIYVGSLSKSIAPGLRLGYVVGPAELITELRGIRRLNLRHPTVYMQRAFALFLSLGHHDALLRRLSAAYRQRAQRLLEALKEHLPEVQATPVSGGASCWVRGPGWLDAAELARAAAELGVLIEPGSVFFNQDTPPTNYFRLGFSSIDDEQVAPGIALLGQALRALAPREKG
ncbi:MocR-like pyridoxine biosynthesis transcription factor PdxR [Denitromonas halophila]|uniref:PLP-dependent aminotransferase family protein n=1 Tax=Denitromonas halophila TaxID=1629404 RepID=A0A557QWZ2_9RHOO|nr:PLP-dependent aminotransferase family protein [Denitromonas halophila]TVO57427.1 PLP-dependent aminotransferase family protein [Denitromonas halophila]